MNIDINKYKHYSFDLWLTLIRSNPLYKNKRDILFKDFFEINDNINFISQSIRYYDILCNRISEKTGKHIDFYHIYYLILNSLKVKIDSLDKTKLDEFYYLSEDLFLQYKPELIFPDLNLTLRQIHESGKTINILSNTAFIKGNTLRKIITQYELNKYFSFQLYSDETGFTKPNPLFFDILMKNINENQTLEKKEIVHIGDNKSADFEGAINYGLNAILV